MAIKARATFEKRQREREKQEKQAEKRARRQAAKDAPSTDGEAETELTSEPR